MEQERIDLRCCIAGGGPAGMMLGLLLARLGIEVLVLEKHADFLRDFRGDTIHPSTLQVMYELGLLEDFLKLPHDQVETLYGQVGSTTLQVADFSHLPTHSKFMVLMPQWDFLDFLAGAAKRYPGFRLRLQAEATELIEAGGRIAGLRAKTPEGTLEVHADLVVAADGRHSLLRAKAGLEVIDLGAPIDALWLRLSRRAGDPGQTAGRFDAGRILVMLNRGSYWQCAFVIRKGGFEAIRAAGLPAFREILASLAPYLADRLEELASWEDVKLLTVQVNRLRQWHRSGFLCIGDAAHAMSPIGGVGINLAIQDAVATANLLGEVLKRGAPSERELQAVQRRRTFPTVMTQGLQVLVQNRVIGRVLGSAAITRLPWLLRLVRRYPSLTRLGARVIGVGFRPEHVSKVTSKGP
ncbi:MAG TPA: FAD-dependent oxidoreductase [Dongiaceae bacterium]|nr:FAD-dependent oxidoreductase [Dongiaceae bacterium]